MNSTLTIVIFFLSQISYSSDPKLCSNSKFKTKQALLTKEIMLDLPVPIPSSALTDLKDIQNLTCLNSLALMFRKDFSSMTPIESLINLKTLNIAQSSISDLSPLIKLPLLEKLDLNGTPVTNLNALQGSKKLKRLNIASTKIESLAPLLKLESLEELTMSNTKVTDLGPILKLPKLKRVQIGSHHKISAAQIELLKKRKVKVIR